MVRDGYYYGLALFGVAVLVAWLTSPAWGTPALVLAAFLVVVSCSTEAPAPAPKADENAAILTRRPAGERIVRQSGVMEGPDLGSFIRGPSRH